MRDLLQGYRATRRGLVRAKRRAVGADQELLGAMISDCTYVIDWLSTGRQPGARRGADRMAVYDREIPVDPERFHRIAAPPPPPRRMEVNDYNRLLQVTAILSRRECACFEMHHVGLWSEYEIADHLGISRDSVHEYLDRAQKKIKDFIGKPIQLELFPAE